MGRSPALEVRERGLEWILAIQAHVPGCPDKKDIIMDVGGLLARCRQAFQSETDMPASTNAQILEAIGQRIAEFENAAAELRRAREILLPLLNGVVQPVPSRSAAKRALPPVLDEDESEQSSVEPQTEEDLDDVRQNPSSSWFDWSKLRADIASFVAGSPMGFTFGVGNAMRQCSDRDQRNAYQATRSALDTFAKQGVLSRKDGAGRHDPLSYTKIKELAQ